MKLNPSRCSSQHRKRIGALVRCATPVEDCYQLAEIHTSFESARIAGKALKGERIGYECLPELRESYRIDGNALSFSLLSNKLQVASLPLSIASPMKSKIRARDAGPSFNKVRPRWPASLIREG